MGKLTAEDNIRVRSHFGGVIVFILLIFFGPATWLKLLGYISLVAVNELIIRLIRRESVYLRIAYIWYRIGALREVKKKIKEKNRDELLKYKQKIK
jgi:predicted CDP-diglyceride synthetase/phosphatidate cytidylyltransferase